MENKGEAPAAAAPAECFRRATVPEDATFVDLAKEQYKQFKEAPMEEHWSCIKNKVLSVFGETPTTIFSAGKDNNKAAAAPPSVESQ